METAFHQKEFWAKGTAPKKSISYPKLVELKLRKESEKLSTNLFLNLGENIFYQDLVFFKNATKTKNKIKIPNLFWADIFQKNQEGPQVFFKAMPV